MLRYCLTLGQHLLIAYLARGGYGIRRTDRWMAYPAGACVTVARGGYGIRRLHRWAGLAAYVLVCLVTLASCSAPTVSAPRPAPPPLATPVQPLPTTVPSPANPEIAVFVLPDDGNRPVLNAIQSAQKTIRLVIYLLLDDEVVDALMAAKTRRGVNVRVMVEPEPFGGGSSRDDVNKLKDAGVTVLDGASIFRYTHQKTLIIDDRVALIMTLNLTHSALTRNREYGVIDTHPARVAEIINVFEADWARRPTKVAQRDLVWSPDNSRDRLLEFLRSATATLDIQVEVLSDNEVEDVLTALARRGVQIRIILPTLEPGDSRIHELDWVVAAGARIRRLREPFPHGKMALVDGTRAWVGSQNLSANSLDNNRELGIFIQDPGALKRLRDTFERDWNRGT